MTIEYSTPSTDHAPLLEPEETPTAIISSFLRDYCNALDDGDVDSWVGFFNKDATYQITTRENVMSGYPVGIVLCAGQGMMRDRVKALKYANVFEDHVYCHILGYPSIRQKADGSFGVRTNFVAYRTVYTGETELFASGKYMDLITLAEGIPRFAERLVVLDSRCVDTLLVYPL